MQMFLAAQGHVAEVARSGPEGIASARRFHPEVVLCDIGLPGIDGYEVARTLRKERHLDGVSLIAVTGYGQETDRLRAREAGFDLHLTKPVNLSELAELLARVG
jgi:CheY-like chemotaxis protein